MSYLVLARKYRSQNFDDVIQQAQVTTTLKNAIGANRVAHAILFTGPRGTGKTTVARILAKTLNCKKRTDSNPCNDCKSCTEITSGHSVDVIEIDGASNNGVEHIRELRENIKYIPAMGAYKIYIIDEVHMLSIAAFNALLKTLEEPPAHIIFLLATTEPHKVPATILSRCQRHEFRRIGLKHIINHLDSICKTEKIAVQMESLSVIAKEAGGSMRDALSLLDQVIACADQAVDYAHVLDVLGAVERTLMYDISREIINGNITMVLKLVQTIYDKGYDLKKFYQDLIEHFRNLIVVKLSIDNEAIVDIPEYEIQNLQAQTENIELQSLYQILNTIIEEEKTIRLSIHPRIHLEMIFVKIFHQAPALPIEKLIDKIDKLRTTPFLPQKTGVSSSSQQLVTKSQEPSRQIPEQKTPTGDPALPDSRREISSNTTGGIKEKFWDEVIALIAKDYPVLATSLRKCEVKTSLGDQIQIDFYGSGFNINNIKRKRNIDLLNEILLKFSSKPPILNFKSKSNGQEASKNSMHKKDALKKKAFQHPLISHTVQVFDGRLIDIKIL